MALAKEDPSGRPNLTVSREPVGPKNAGDKGSPGDVALMDCLKIIGGAWIILALLLWSLRSHNI